jgi:hypothetical protein
MMYTRCRLRRLWRWVEHSAPVCLETVVLDIRLQVEELWSRVEHHRSVLFM